MNTLNQALSGSRLNLRTFTCGFTLVFALIASGTCGAFSNIVIFGDSLSDTGNHPAALLGTPYPYYENRISNGPVAVDVLAAGLNLTADHSGHIFNNGNGSNYAVSGANAAGSEAHDLVAQWEAFIGSRQSIDRSALYFVMIGGNDVRDAAVIEDEVQANNAVNLAADAVNWLLEQLIEADAKHLIVSNVPDISAIPETDDRADSNPGIRLRAQTLSQAFNLRLANHLAAIESDLGVEPLVFDFYARFNELLAAPQQYGFSNSTEACFDNAPYSFHPDCDFEQFVFFDSIHPSAKTHQILGENILDLALEMEEKRVNLGGVLMLLLE